MGGMASEASTGPDPDDVALLHKQLDYYQAWLCSLTQAPLQAVALNSMQSAVRVVVSGFPDTASAEDLRNIFEGLIAANHAAVAPGSAVKSCDIQPGSPASAVLQLRCSAEASNCLAFDGLVWNTAVLKVERPQDYDRQVAILLGPTEPNPAVLAAVSGSATGSTAAGGSFVAAVRSRAAAAGHAGRAQAGGGAAASSKVNPRDLLLPADQSKQDEVFIGGLASHWKAQQLKELLAPYGQLKSLSVAMDAATGKNKGYAFVVFASPDMVSHAIEELDCRVVEGKILAVQRATEGKASYGRESSAGGNDIGSLRDGGFAGPQPQHQPQHQAPAAPQQHQPQAIPPQHPPSLLRHHHHRSSSTGSVLPPQLPCAPSAPQEGAPAAAPAGPSAAPGVAFPNHGRGSSAGAPAGPAPLGPAPPSAVDNSVLGPRPPPAGNLAGSGGGSAMQHHSGPSSAKQYDINELYIGDLPLTWDEDAVRRLLGRFGRIKYFTLRNGRDKNFAFCKFKDSSVVDAAIAGLHGKIVDGYFLNVRRAIEGKQQNSVPGASPQAQQQWLTGKQPPVLHPHHQQHSQQQQQANVRASFDATSTRAAPPGHRPRMSADQQQLSKLASAATAAGPPMGPPGPTACVAGPGKGAGLLGHPFAGPHGQRGNVLGSGGAAGHQQERQAAAGGRGEQQQRNQLLLLREQERAKAGSPPGAAAPGAGGRPAKQSQEGTSAGSTAPSTPGTPTMESTAAAGAAADQAQQQQGAGAAAAGAPAVSVAAVPPVGTAGPGVTSMGGYQPFMGPQLLQRPAMQLPMQQQQQQQHLLQQQQQQHLLQQQQQRFQAHSGYAPPAAAPLFPPGPLPPSVQASDNTASLFGPNGPASWPGTASLAAVAAAAATASPATAAGNLALPGAPGGAFSSSLGMKQQQEPVQGPATQAQSLLQTWDMLSPWSLFSHTSS